MDTWFPVIVYLLVANNHLATFVHGISLRGPPIVSNELRPLQVVQLGQEFRIICPIEGDPTPIIDWYKDGEAITPAWSPRFRINSKILKIRSVYSEDAGIYECKGVNGFGSQMARTRIIISDEEMVGEDEKPLYLTNNNSNDRRRSETSKTTSIPKFTSETTEQIGPMHVTQGNTIRLRCEAKGTLLPKINWLKNGKSVGDKLWKWTSWTLILNKLTVEDSGTYTCIANNTSGRIEFNIQLVVTEIVEKKRPELATGDPNNTTVLAGDEAVLECIVRASTSTLPPHIKWLKRVSDEEYYNNMKTSIVRGGRHKHRLLPKLPNNNHVLVIQATQDKGIRITESQNNGTFISKLIISKTDPSHSGSYICLATNSAGFSYKEIAMLNVRSVSLARLATQSESVTPVSPSTISFPLLVIGISLAATVMIVGAACILRKYQEQRQPKLSKSMNPLKLASVSSVHVPGSIAGSHNSHSSRNQHNRSQQKCRSTKNNNISSNKKDGYDSHQLLVSTTSTHSSSSSSGHVDTSGDVGVVNHFCKDHQNNHFRSSSSSSSNKFVDPIIEMTMPRGSRCGCSYLEHEYPPPLELDSSPFPDIQPYEHCYSHPNFTDNCSSGSIHLSHPSYYGHWR